MKLPIIMPNMPRESCIKVKNLPIDLGLIVGIITRISYMNRHTQTKVICNNLGIRGHMEW